MGKNDTNKMMGGIATVLFHAILVAVLVCSYLYYSYPPKDKDLIEMKKEEILFGGEYVMLGDFIQPSVEDVAGTPVEKNTSENPEMSGEEPMNEGEIGEIPEQTVTQNAESPMKVKKEEVKPGSTEAERAAEAERVRKEKETAERINKRVSFGKTGGDGTGSAGVPTGSATSRSASGAPGVSGLEGYTLASWGEPSSPVNGVVRIQVRVSARGKVISAAYVGGSGSAASNSAVRRSCEQASLQSQFSVPKNKTTEGVGVITWKFEN